MRKHLTSKKSLLLGAILAIVVATAAYAYLTASGSGSGTGSATAEQATMTLTSSSLSFTAIDQVKTVDITASNPNSSPLRLSGLTATAAVADAATDCPDGSFAVVAVRQTSNVEVPAKAGATNGTAKVGEADVKFVNSATAPQDDCIGTDTVELTFGS